VPELKGISSSSRRPRASVPLRPTPACEPELALNEQPVLLIDGGSGRPGAFVTSAGRAKETYEIAARALSLRWRRWAPE
jgi:hypothetical protein